MPTAPEHANVVVKMCASFSATTRERLAFKWLDRCVRVHAANGLERAGYKEESERLRNLPELRDRGACMRAHDVIGAIARLVMTRSHSAKEILASMFGLMATVTNHLHDSGPNLHLVVIGVVTAARCAGAWDEERTQLDDVMFSSN